MAARKSGKKAGKKGIGKAMPKLSGKQKEMALKSLFAIAAIIILAIFIAYGDRIFLVKDTKAVAEVNGKEISSDELDRKYELLVSPEYREQVTKEIFLNQTIIPETLLLQEAEKQGIEVSEEETKEYIIGFIEQSGMTEDEFKEQLKEQDISYDEFVDFYSQRLTIIMLLNSTVKIEDPTEEEIKEFYDESMESFSFGNVTIGYEDVKDQIESVLISQRQQEAVERYMLDMRSKASIKMYPENINENVLLAGTFSETNDEICYEDGKPVIRLFSTTACPHCKWIKKTFDSVAREYADNGLVVAHHWELDQKDDALTGGAESLIPAGELEVLQRYGNGGVPLFVFGCRYVRVGNAFEFQDDLDAEESEFRAVIESLLAEQQMQTEQAEPPQMQEEQS